MTQAERLALLAGDQTLRSVITPPCENCGARPAYAIAAQPDYILCAGCGGEPNPEKVTE